MTAIVFVVTGIVLVFFAFQAAMAARFIAALRNGKRKLIAEDDCPRAVVILCLRGEDPFLEDCLQGVLNQDYPRYEVRVIVDHENDPAHAVVRGFLEQPEADKLRIRVLKNRRETCSLKCSSLIEATDPLEVDGGILAFLDADTVPHATWLRELATALQPAEVGAATGNRWYVPATASLGAITRFLWNAFAIVQMYCFRIPWGGSLALKSEVVRQANLSESWATAFCEDTMLYRILDEQNLRIAFVPSVLMANREDCKPGELCGWIRRQLLTVRLYHPWWPAVLLHGIFTAALPILLGAGLLLSIIARDWGAVTVIAAITIGYGLAMGALLHLIEAGIRRIFAARGESADWVTPPALAKFLAAIPLLQVIYPVALASALFLRKTAWRGINYRIEGAWKIRRLDYEPHAPGKENTTESL